MSEVDLAHYILSPTEDAITVEEEIIAGYMDLILENRPDIVFRDAISLYMANLDSHPDDANYISTFGRAAVIFAAVMITERLLPYIKVKTHQQHVAELSSDHYKLQ